MLRAVPMQRFVQHCNTTHACGNSAAAAEFGSLLVTAAQRSDKSRANCRRLRPA